MLREGRRKDMDGRGREQRENWRGFEGYIKWNNSVSLVYLEQ